MFSGLGCNSGSDSSQTAWFALRVKSKREKSVSLTLRSRGYSEFLPTYLCRRLWSDRIKQLELPVFPGYVFARFDPHDRLPVLSIPGVLHIVGTGRIPVPVNANELAAIGAAVQSRAPLEPWPYMGTGQRVLIERGPLLGLEGILIETRKDFRLVISVSLLHRSVAIEIERQWVRPVAKTDRIPAPAPALSEQAGGAAI